jgi:hypothetical protein
MKIDLSAEVNAEIQTNLKAQNAAEIQAEIDSQRQVNFKSSMTVAAGFEPTRYAEAVQLERASGVPAKVAYDNWDKVQQVKQEDKLAGLFTTTPRTADALSNPQHAIIAKGDEENLQYMERAVERATFDQQGFFDRQIAGPFQKWWNRDTIGEAPGRLRQLDRITTDFDRVDAGDDFSSPWANEYRAADEAGRKVMRDNLQLEQNLSIEKTRGAQFEIGQMPIDPGDVAFDKAQGVAGVASTIANDPLWAARKAGESLPDMAQGLALGLINPIFGSVSEGTTAANYKLIEVLQEKGIDPSDPIQLMKALRDDDLMNEANARAARYGAGIGAVSLLSFGLLGKVMAPTAIGGKALTTGQRELISAGVQMPVQGALEAAGEAAGQLAERGRTSDLDSKEIALEGFLGTLMAVPEAGGFAGKRFMQHMAQARRTERAATLQTDLVGKSLESSTRKNDPATFDAIVGAQLAGKPNEWLEIPAAKLQELNQSGQVNVPELLEQINVDPNHYAAQVELGGTVRMKNSSYLAYLAEYDEQLSSSVRFSTNDMSLEEVQAIDKQMLADMEQVAQNFGKTDQVAAAYSDVMGQLLGAGYERSAADTTARQYAAVMTRLAEQTGQTVEDVMAANPLNIGRDLPPAVRRIKGDEINLMLGRLRAGDIPRPADMFGKSLTEYLTAAGGLDDTGGELAAFDADVGKIGRNRLARAGGKSLDDAAMAAWERGYFPGMAREDVTPNMLIDALREEAAGTPRFSVEQENATLRDQAANLEALQAYLDEQGIDLETATDEEVLALLRPGQPTDTSLEQFAGPRALTANQKSLAEAKQRLQEGDDAEQVRKETGWFTGADGMLRFEIADGDAKLTPTIDAMKNSRFSGDSITSLSYREAGGLWVVRVVTDGMTVPSDIMEFVTQDIDGLAPLIGNGLVDRMKAGEGEQDILSENEADKSIDQISGENFVSPSGKWSTLSEVLDHPRLFEAYPELADLKVVYAPEMTGGAAGAMAINARTGEPVMVLGDGKSDELRKTVLHETQHAIQNIEGFAQGGSVNRLRNEPDHASEIAAVNESFQMQQWAKQWPEAAELRQEISDLHDQLEQQYGDPFSDEAVESDTFAKWQAAIERSFDVEGYDQAPVTNVDELAPLEIYHRLAGEIEARTIEARAHMTDRIAKLIPPSMSKDLPDAEAIVYWDGEDMPSVAIDRAARMSTTLNQEANPELARALAMTEDEYIAAVNPENKRSDEADIVIVRTGDLDMPRDARPTAGFKDKTGADVQVFVDGNGSIYAQQDGEVVGQIENRDGETLNIVTVEAQGKGIGQGLAAELIRRDPFAQAGSFSPAGEATRRAAFRQVKAEQRTTLNQDATDYRDEHTAPGREDAAPLSDLTGEGTIYPDDVYSTNGPRYYGTGVPYDKKAFQIASKVRGNPDAMVTIYRAVPSGVTTAINPGDWVAITREYADAHGESRFDGDYDVIEMQVRAGDIFTNGDSIQEWGYDPESTTLNQSQPGAAQTETEAFKRWFGDSKVVDAAGKPRVVYHGTARDFTSFSQDAQGDNFGDYEGAFPRDGFWFTDTPSNATWYANVSANGLEGERAGSPGQQVLPVYLSIQNPYVYDAAMFMEEGEAGIPSQLDLERQGYDGLIVELAELAEDTPKADAFRMRVGAEKYNGNISPFAWSEQDRAEYYALLESEETVRGHTHYVAFRPEQVKSAVGNRGTFDPASPNILEQAGEDDARGSITFGPRQDGVRRFDIKLGKKSDLSTVLHEMGHYYLEVIGDLVMDGKANELLAADYGVIRDWLGAEAGKPLSVDQHEQFARGFEKYLATGKAPSIELQDAFARFKRWLVGVYKDLARLNVEISPEVRGVFDRLLASEQAITEAEQALALTEQYEARITELMSPDEKANYLRASRQARDDATSEIEQEILKAEQQKEQRWYKEQRRKVEAEVRDELEASQAYQARKYLFGNTPHPDIGRALRLDTAAVTELFGTKSKEARFLGRARARENGVHPEIAASILGYPNPVEMLTDMRAVPSLAEAVKLETERRMAERYPDPRKDGTLADKAMAAVGEREAEVQAIQLRTLARQAGRAPSQHKIIKEAARRHIASLKLRDVIPHAFRRASEKAARAVEDALIKGDMPKAYEEKEKQLMNLHLFREAVKAQDLSIQKRAQAKAYTKAGAKRKRLQDASVENYELAYPDGRIEYAATKTAAKQAEAEGATVTPLFNFLEQVDAILTRYEFSIPRRAIRQQREALVEFLASMSGEHIVVNPPEWILLDRSQRTNWSELTIDELVDAVDMIKQIDQMAKNKLQVLKAGRWEEFEPIRDAIVNSIELNASAARSSQFNKSFADDIRRWGREWLGLLPVDQIARELDGQDDLGPVQENITTPVQVAARKAVIREKAEHQALAELIKQFYSDDQIKGMAEKRIAVAEINDSLTKMQMIMLMANLGNEGNRKALMSEQRGIWSAETIQSVMSRLDSNDADFVEALWAWVDKFWPEVSENEARRTGVTPAKVENDPYPVKLADGKVRVLKGGYFPLKYDGDMSIKTSQDDVANAFKNMTAGRTAKAYTPEGHRIERVGSGGRPVKLDLSVVLGHVNEVVRDIVMTDPVNQSWRYLHDGEIQGAFERSNLKEIFTALEIWLQDTAEGEKVDSGYMTASARWLRTGFTANVMLFNLANSALNLAGTHPLVVLGKRWALNGYRNAMKPANWQQMYELSEYMREARVDSYSKDLQLVQDHMRNKGGWRDVMTQAGFYLHNKTQMFMDAVTWMGAYEKGMSMDLVGQELITYADQRVVEASGSGVFADRSAMERGTITRQTRQNELVRGLTTLAGYMIRKMAIARRRTAETDFKDVAQAVNWAVDMALLFTVEGLMFALVKGNVPDEEDEDQAAGWAKAAGWETFAGALSGLPPYGRPLVSAIQGFGGGSSSIDIFAEQFGNALTQAKQGDADVTAAKALIAMVGTATKTPGIATNRVIDWLDRAQDGETPPWYELLTGNRDK